MLDLTPVTAVVTKVVMDIGDDQLGGPTPCRDTTVADLAAQAFVRSAVEQNPGGSPGLFAAPVSVPDTAPPLDRLIGMTGRDPAWQPS